MSVEYFYSKFREGNMDDRLLLRRVGVGVIKSLINNNKINKLNL